MNNELKKALTSVAVAALTVVSAPSCTETGQIDKTKMGAVIGVAAGAAIGASVADDNKAAGILIGGLVGGLVGGKIGAMLTERDKQRLAQSTQETIRTGEAQTWTNPETGVKATTVVKEETVSPPKQVQIPVLKNKVQQLPPLDFIGEDYSTTANVNVRGGPGTDYVVVDKLAQGQATRVVGKVVGADWYMISKNNAGSGFVAGSLLKPAPATAPPVATPPAAPAGEVTNASVAATSTCRVVTQEVSKDGQTTSQNVKACRGPNGWEIVAA